MIKNLTAINYSRKFQKQLKQAPTKIKIAFKRKREIFIKNPFDPLLNNHQLIGKYKGYKSINVTGDWRAIYSEEDGMVIFEMLGTHSQLYR